MKRRIINLLLVGFLLTPFAVGSQAEAKTNYSLRTNEVRDVTPTTFSRIVAASSDDGREIFSGAINLTADYLETGGREDSDTHGIRFTNIVIPEGAEITEAYIEFYSHGSGPASGSNIYAEIGDAKTYSTAAKNISSRNYSENRVYWFNWAWTAKVKQTTPNLKNLIDENRLKGWKSGQSIAFKFDGVGYNKGGSVYSYNGGGSKYRPCLVIKYLNNGNGPQITPPALNESYVTFASLGDTDAYENYAGKLNYTVNNLVLGGKEDGNLHAVRFPKVHIPEGAEITEAYIDFNAYGTSPSATTVIHTEIGSAKLYSAQNISSRTYSQNNIIWTPDAFTSANVMHSSPDLKNIIDENRLRGWKSGEPMAFLFKGMASEGIAVHSFEGPAAYRPRLIIRYTNNGNGASVTPSALGIQSSVVKAGADDAHESGTGAMNLTRAYLNLGGRENSENDKHAMRFTDLDIPLTAEVTEAYIEFYSYSSSLQACMGIVAEVGNAAQYTTATKNISSRNYTTSKTYWVTTSPWTSNYTKHVTGNLKNLVEEIRLKGWRTGQSMAFMFDGLSYNGGAIVRSYEGGAKYRPRLIVKYNNNGKGPTLSTVFTGGYSTLTAKGSDDASQESSGKMDISNGRLYLGGRKTTKINAVRFSKVEIPAHAEVLQAYVEFFARGNSSSAKIKIQSEIGNPTTYTTSSQNITSRAYSTNVIDWTTTAWTSRDYARYQTPNLKNIVEENRLRGWKSGQAMAFKFEGLSVNSGAEAYTVEGSNYFRPRLVVAYLISGRGPVIGPDGVQITNDMEIRTISVEIDEEDTDSTEKLNRTDDASGIVDEMLSSMDNFKVYPNPVTTTLNLDIDISGNSSVSAYIYSLSGKLMINKEIKFEKAIDVSSLSAGVYLIRIVDKANPKNNKATHFIKQ